MLHKLIIGIMLLILSLVAVPAYADEKQSAKADGKVAMQDCGIHYSDLIVENPIERVQLLSERAADLFQSGDIPCAMSILKKAAAMIGEMRSGQERAIAGYEIKDVVFDSLGSGKLTDSKDTATSVYLALQSITADLAVSQSSTTVERINDAAFLFRVWEYLKEKNNVNDATEYFLLMLRIGKTLEKSKVPYSSYDLSRFAEWLLKESEFLKLVRILEEIPQGDYRASIVNTLKHNVLYDIGRAEKNLNDYKQNDRFADYDSRTILRFADDAEKLMQVLSADTATMNDISIRVEKKGGSALSWKINLHRFIWRSYLTAGKLKDAQQKLNTWVSAIRQLDDRIVRVYEMIKAAQYVYHAKTEKQFALSLLQEAEEDAKLIDDPKHRKDKLEWISRAKKFMK